MRFLRRMMALAGASIFPLMGMRSEPVTAELTRRKVRRDCVYRARSKYMPHQGKQEIARRYAMLQRIKAKQVLA